MKYTQAMWLIALASYSAFNHAEVYKLKLTGVAGFSEPIALPDKAILHLKLFDSSLPLDPVAETILPIVDQPPYEFEFKIDKYTIDSSEDYQLTACIHNQYQDKIWQTLINPTVIAKGRPIGFINLKLRKLSINSKDTSALPTFFSLRKTTHK